MRFNSYNDACGLHSLCYGSVLPSDAGHPPLYTPNGQPATKGVGARGRVRRHLSLLPQRDDAVRGGHVKAIIM